VVEASRDLFGLSSSSQFELLHRGRAVDLSIPFRLTGISNNATLGLRESAAKGADAVQQVRVAVQLPDGKRLQEVFGSDATLERILSAFQQLPASAGQEVRCCAAGDMNGRVLIFERSSLDSFRSRTCSARSHLMRSRRLRYKVRAV
jgi:hypothetical protein